MTTTLSILMATHNGAGTLPRVLDAYTRLDYPAEAWNVIIVDNASTDATRNLLADYAKRLPLSAVHTQERGKNRALNLALTYPLGDLVVLTDDDAVPTPDWLSQLAATANAQQDFDIFGGKIDPVWPDSTPAWISRLVNLGATYAITPDDMREGPVSAAQIWGPNMAVRRSVFDAGHRFDASVGPQAGQYIMGSEVEFTCRMEAQGHRAWFCADAHVGHIIRPRQIEREWIVQRAYRLGRHMFHQEASQIPVTTARLFGSPRWKYRELVDGYLSRTGAWLTRDDDAKFLADWQISFLKGYLAEGRRMSDEAQST